MNRLRLLPLLALALLTTCKPNRQSDSSQVQFARTDNTVIIRLEGDADRLNPILTTTDYGRQVVENIFQYLLSYDPHTLKVEPELAKSSPVVEDITSGPYKGGVAYTFEIFDNAVWDNGFPVTGNDYVFTLKAVLNPLVQAAHVRPYLTDIRAVEVDAKNPRKFKVILSQKSIFGEETVSNIFPVLPAYLYDPESLLKDIPVTDFTDPEKVEKLAKEDPRLQQFAEAFNGEEFSHNRDYIGGSGPYQLEFWETGQNIILRKKADWWGERHVRNNPSLIALPDALSYKVIPNPATAIAALKAEEIDVMNNILPEDFVGFQQDSFVRERYNLTTANSLSYFYIAVNGRKPLFADKLVRQALAHAVNVDEIISEVFQGFGERIVAPVPKSVEYYPSSLKPIPFDIEKSKSLLKQAGWEDTNNNGVVDKMVNGKRAELSVTYLLNASSETSRNIGLLIQDNARKAGIDLKLEPKDPTVMLDQLRQRDFELVSAGRTLTPLWNPMQNWHTEGDNRTGFGNAETDALIEEILITLDTKKRNQLYRKLEDIMYDQQNEILLFSPKDRIAIHKRFDAETSSFFPGFVPKEFRLNLD